MITNLQGLSNFIKEKLQTENETQKEPWASGKEFVDKINNNQNTVDPQQYYNQENAQNPQFKVNKDGSVPYLVVNGKANRVIEPKVMQGNLTQSAQQPTTDMQSPIQLPPTINIGGYQPIKKTIVEEDADGNKYEVETMEKPGTVTYGTKYPAPIKSSVSMQDLVDAIVNAYNFTFNRENKGE